MDAAKKAHGIPSDYRLAQVLGVTRATVSTWRNGRSFPGYSSTCVLSTMAGMELGAALLAVGVDRLQQPENAPRRARLKSLLMPDAMAAEHANR